ncbi:3-oxoacyl-[acyl-carrier protein] reductase [Selenomonas ruminantium]|uniref:3-oxoacyl-[acyl-carrier protein] reductase n=1 Tax=Selenomonas ruminantium TaxID=971 RepID=A0A1M6W2E1_SELRU|nr:3-oxoacyl-[acyl-carrier protein] reductase [Selenomonas ruminantium]
MNPFQLNDKNIIVTGTASGIGRDTAMLLHEMGAKCMLLDMNEEGLAETNRLIDNKGLCYVCNLT